MHTLRLLWAANNETTLQRRQTRVNRRKMVQIVEMEELEFVHRFRLDKQSFWHICDDLRRFTSLKGTREISLEIKVLCTLSFLATGSYQRIVGLTQHLVQRTTSRCIRQVVEALRHPAILNKWILFPSSQQQRAQIRLEFQRRFRLPGIVGCIDCILLVSLFFLFLLDSHVAIVKPSDEEHLFFNRKGYHSLNVQIVCNSNLKITNVNPKFGGATHDSFIWASSRMETFMRELHQNGEQVWLLGDSGYPQRPWLMTPILNAVPGSVEDTYTQRHANLPPPSIMEVEEDDAQPDNASDSVGAASDQSQLLQGRAVLNNLLSGL
ncbi:unnamed protein product [Parnassius apollo]|uniref:(apollo) hypothetical protein n=1 Tax=Parnassius apollo TaxID=110799 RepID=A0A8S3YAR8_PARAO|nr:unnamed protein product [Parnassius apollo]